MADALDKLMDAIDDYCAAHHELMQMRSEYTGYSPDYHLASWFEAEKKAKERIAKLLESYVRAIIADVRTENPVTGNGGILARPHRARKGRGRR